MNKSDVLARDIREQIRSGQLEAGSRMPTVSAYASEHGISTGTVRAVYKRLETEGLLLVSQSGTTVRKRPTHRLLVPGPDPRPWEVHDQEPGSWEEAHSWVYGMISAQIGTPLWRTRRTIGPTGEDPWCIETVWRTARSDAEAPAPAPPSSFTRARVALPVEEELELLGAAPMPVFMLARPEADEGAVTVWTIPGDRVELALDTPES